MMETHHPHHHQQQQQQQQQLNTSAAAAASTAAASVAVSHLCTLDDVLEVLSLSPATSWSSTTSQDKTSTDEDVFFLTHDLFHREEPRVELTGTDLFSGGGEVTSKKEFLGDGLKSRGPTDAPAAATNVTGTCSSISGRRRKMCDRSSSSSASDESSDLSDSDACQISSDSDTETFELAKCHQFAEEFLAFGIKCKPSFWQYNCKSRGPKASRVLPPAALANEQDFYRLTNCIDPVFDKKLTTGVSCQRNKAKRSEGNDLHPDPIKLLTIGQRISKMEEKLKVSTPGDSGKKVINSRSRLRNKIASRICRMKKKAQQEAYKIKLEGLRQEHGQLTNVCLEMLVVMDSFIRHSSSSHGQPVNRNESLCSHLQKLITRHLGNMIAGYTVQYVNKELEAAANRIIASYKNTEKMIGRKLVSRPG